MTGSLLEMDPNFDEIIDRFERCLIRPLITPPSRSGRIFTFRVPWTNRRVLIYVFSPIIIVVSTFYIYSKFKNSMFSIFFCSLAAVINAFLFFYCLKINTIVSLNLIDFL